MSENNSTGRVANKVALITGAGSGIGRATAMTLARHGATVICADVRHETVDETARCIVADGGQSLALRLDVTVEDDWQQGMEQLVDAYGRLDIAVNCAGISFAAPVAEMSLQDWRRVMAVNLEGVFLGTRHAIRVMRQARHGGSIINVSSVSGLKAYPETSAYGASKAAVIHFSKTAALECRQQGNSIRVNCISPSGVKTPMWKTMPFFQELMAQTGSEEGAFEALAGMSPHGRWALPDEVAIAILYLASDDSSFVTGTNLVFDNGDA